MTDAKKYKLALGGFVVMVILNAAVLISMWVMKPPHLPRRHPGNTQARVQRFLQRQLNLNPQQQKAFHQLRRKQIDRSRKLIRDIQQKRGQLVTLLKSNEAPNRQTQADSLIALIGNDQTRLEHDVFTHFVQLRQLCNPRQKKKFDQIIEHVLRRYGHPKPKP